MARTHTYPPTGPHDTLGTRQPQQMRPYACRRGIRRCPVRPTDWLLDGEGPHAKSWLFERGDTVRLRSGR